MPAPRDPRRAAAFTLIEVMVALAIVSVTLLAALRAAGQAAGQAGELRNRLLAGWVAENHLVEQRARREWLPAGTRRGSASQGGVAFTWREEISATPNPLFRRVDLYVHAGNGDPHVLAHLAGFIVLAPGDGALMAGLAHPGRGFTLVEVLAVLLVLGLLSLAAYRGLSVMLESRGRVAQETEKWRRVNTFFQRFEGDAARAAPVPSRQGAQERPAWLGLQDGAGAAVEFSRFAAAGGTTQRVAYRLNGQGAIELWLWPALDNAPGQLPARYPLLEGVVRLELQYLDDRPDWTATWPAARGAAALPRAVRLHLVLDSGESVVRIFGLRS